MADRIIKDIRYYESNDIGKIPSYLGKLFHPTKDTNYIGQRIARKLNEFNYSYGEIDHIYINLTTVINENDISISKRNLDKRIKYIDYGLSPKIYNALSDNEKNNLVKLITFRVLKHISTSQNSILSKVEEVEMMMSEADTEIRIHYKIKETNNYKINIDYQINPINASTRAIVEYVDKRDNSKREGFIPLQLYEDIYSLIDTITLKGETLIFNPKKSFIADVSNKRYLIPIKIKIFNLKKYLGSSDNKQCAKLNILCSHRLVPCQFFKHAAGCFFNGASEYKCFRVDFIYQVAEAPNF